MLKISKYILMKVHEGKDESIVVNGPKPTETEAMSIRGNRVTL